MTKAELWKIYVKANPAFDGDGKITLSAAGLRKFFDQTWEVSQHNADARRDRVDDLFSKLMRHMDRPVEQP